jgi:hypothetical protein
LTAVGPHLTAVFSTVEADTVNAIASVLQGFGCPPDKCPEMALQLHRRAGQLSEAKGRSYEEALGHLLRAMAGGWAAQSQVHTTDPQA